MSADPKFPWRLATNERYREVIRLLIGLSSTTLLLPVFFARQFLAIDATKPLREIFSQSLYWSWGILILSIFSGILFHFLSAKWVRLAWEKPVGIFGMNASENFIENMLTTSFWFTALSFIGGLGLILIFFTNYQA